ncbi:hypothetical protein [Noviherbaspirillum soli]|uniref:hypothetical protein n=1 Tax=Noviherbaspirillum soli TaxID=1064518 RepID=UPI00188C4254|nr:hypothetical protein [Noviherbaspirillum soli]
MAAKLGGYLLAQKGVHFRARLDADGRHHVVPLRTLISVCPAATLMAPRKQAEYPSAKISQGLRHLIPVHPIPLAQ